MEESIQILKKNGRKFKYKTIIENKKEEIEHEVDLD